jgi:TP901 family phage tail tape measure protein
MADQIRREDVIEDGAIKAPLELRDNFLAVIPALGSLIEQMGSLEKRLASATSLTKLKAEVGGLTKAQKELHEAQKVIIMSHNEVAQYEKKLADQTKRTNSVVNEQEKAMAEAANAATAWGGAIEQTGKKAQAAARETQKAYVAEKGSLEELIQKRDQLKKYIDAEKRSQKEEAIALKEGNVTRAQYNETINASNARIAEYGNKLKDANKEIAAHIALEGKDAKVINAKNASLKVLEAALNKNREAYAKLTAEEQRNSKEGLELIRIINAQDNEVKGLRKSMGEHQKEVGRYGLAMKNLGSQILSTFGIMASVAGVIQIFRSLIGTTRDFSKAVSELSAITGATGEDLEFYKQQAKEIGATTSISAVQAVEAFKLIGSARPELLKVKEDLAAVTKEAVTLAEASGMELPDAAIALAGAMNQLQLPASEASRVINALAAGAKAGAAEITPTNEALQKFGTVAQNANISIEESVGLIQTLADRQIQGAEAGTQLRNVLLAMSAATALPKSAVKALGRYGVDMQILGDKTIPVIDRLRELGKVSNDQAALVKVFGKENVVAGQIILQNIDRFEELTKAVTGTNVAYEQAQTNLDNLAGDQFEASAATEALAIQIGESLNGALRGAVQGYTVFINVIRETPKFIRENKDLIFLLAAALIGLKIPLITSAALKLKDAAATRLKIIADKAALISTRALYAAIAANPFGAVLIAITAVVAAIKLYDRFSSRANEVNKKTVELNKDLDTAIQKVKESRQQLNISIDEFNKLSPKEQKALQDQIKLRKEETLAILENILAKQQSVGEVAKELTGWQKLGVGALVAVDGYMKYTNFITRDFIPATHLAADAARNWSNENRRAAESVFDEKIAQLKQEIEEMDNFLVDSSKEVAAAEEQKSQAALDRLKRIREAEYQLAKWRIENSIKANEEIVKSETSSEEQISDAIRVLTEQRMALAKLERDNALSKEKLTAAEKILIIEQYNAKVLEIEHQTAKELEKLREEVRKKDIEKAKHFSDRLIQANQNSMDQEIQIVMAAARQGVISKEQAEKQIFEIKKRYGIQVIELQIKQLEELLELDKLSASERAEVEKQLHKLKMELNEAYFNAIDNSRSQELQRLDAFWAEVERIYSDSTNALLNFSGALMERKIQDLDAEKEAVITQREELLEHEAEMLEKSLEREGLTAEQKTAIQENAKLRQAEIEQEFAKKEEAIEEKKRKAQQRQARFEKAVALVGAAINTAKAVTAALPNIPLSVLIGVIGAIQIAAIAAKPIPAAAEGITNHKGGPIRVGEEGVELIKYASGKVGFTPDHDSVINLERGASIIPHDETLQWLAKNAIANMMLHDRPHYKGSDNAGVERKLERIERAIKGKKEVIVEGRVTGERRNNTRIRYIQSLRNAD